MKHFALFFIALFSIASSLAQTVVIYPKSGDAITYNMSDIDHIEFLPDGSSDNPDDNAEYSVNELWCHRGELNIYGKIYRPANVAADVQLPTVILSHSASLTADAMNAYAVAIAKAGFCAYAFDFCGACDDSRSDGNVDEMTPFTEVDDLKAVISEMKSNPGVNPEKICLLGSSLGGLVSALTAEDASLGIAGLILFYPAFNIPDLIALIDQFGGFGGGGWGDLGGFGMSYSEAFCNSMRGYDVYANIGTFSKKVLILHGSNDMIVKISYSQQAVETYPDATLVTIEGANHGFNADNLGSFGSMGGSTTDYDSIVIPQVISYLNTYLQ
ncbi:MAG: alpha/beta hydrolase [Muribaculaceae bacterium]